MLLVLASDLHLGRASARLPETAAPREHSAAKAWLRLCHLAVERGAAAVLLAGDQFDRDNRYFEASGAWERGLTVLHNAAIPCVAVSGNHDHVAFPTWVDQRAAQFPHFHALGMNATWESLDLPGLRCIGWSFPRATERVATSAVAGFPQELITRQPPTVALVHADLDASASPYHPVRIAELRGVPVTLWVTGHLHAPRLITGGAGPALVNPGTPQALDPGEPGLHGAVLASRVGETWQFEPAPLSSVRYEAVDWTVGEGAATTSSGATTALADPVDAMAAAAALQDACAQAANQLRPTPLADGTPALLVLRPRLRGASRWTAAAWSGWLDLLAAQLGDSMRLDPLPPELSPALPEDLDALAERHRDDALGVALHLRKALLAEDPSVEPLVADAHRTLDEAARRFVTGEQLGEGATATPPPTQAEARARLLAEVDALVLSLFDLRPEVK